MGKIKLDKTVSIWYKNKYYRNILNAYISNKLTYSFSYDLLHLIRICFKFKFILKWTFFVLSITLRLVCVYVIVYILKIMINETDSWIPMINLIFCFGILYDLIYYITRRKEHTGLAIMLKH